MKNLFRYRAEKNPKAWLFLIPALIFISVFNFLPLIRAVVMAFRSNSVLNPHFVGIENFKFIIQDPQFHRAIANTALYAIVVVPVGMVLSMFIALIINSKIKGYEFFETIFFIPYLTSIIAIGIVFRYLFNGQFGLVNHLLGFVGLGPYEWLNNPDMNMITLIIFGIWSAMAFNIIIMLSGLRSIDQSYYKIADMFGATKNEQFWKITMPTLTPIITFLSITNFISAFKVYGQVFALFNGKAGIGNRAVTAVFYIFNKFYVENRYGQGMAAAVVLLIFLIFITIIQRKVLAKFSE